MQMTFAELNPENYPKQSVGVEGFLVNLFPLLESGQDLKICEELLSLKYSGLRLKESPRLFSLKTWQDYSITTEEEPLEQSLMDFGNLGMMSNGRCLILKTLESHKKEKGYSLSEVLEKEVDEKYFLSQKKIKFLKRAQHSRVVTLGHGVKGYILSKMGKSGEI